MPAVQFPLLMQLSGAATTEAGAVLPMLPNGQQDTDFKDFLSAFGIHRK